MVSTSFESTSLFRPVSDLRSHVLLGSDWTLPCQPLFIDRYSFVSDLALEIPQVLPPHIHSCQPINGSFFKQVMYSPCFVPIGYVPCCFTILPPGVLICPPQSRHVLYHTSNGLRQIFHRLWQPSVMPVKAQLPSCFYPSLCLPASPSTPFILLADLLKILPSARRGGVPHL